MALSQLRQSYPDIRNRNAELVQVGPNLPTHAARALAHYLGGRELEFPYLCDPEWRVHAQYGLLRLGMAETLKTVGLSAIKQVTSRPFVRPVADEVRRIATHTVQQGLFVIDGDGLVCYRYVTTPTGPLPPASTLLAVLDGLPS